MLWFLSSLYSSILDDIHLYSLYRQLSHENAKREKNKKNQYENIEHRQNEQSNDTISRECTKTNNRTVQLWESVLSTLVNLLQRFSKIQFRESVLRTQFRKSILQSSMLIVSQNLENSKTLNEIIWHLLQNITWFQKKLAYFCYIQYVFEKVYLKSHCNRFWERVWSFCRHSIFLFAK